MIFNKRKKEKIRQNIIDNLTLCRLEGDLLAVEAAIRDNAPKAEPEVEGNRIKKFVAGLVNDLSNTVRAATVRELSVDKEKAKAAITAFSASHVDSNLDLCKNPDEFKAYIAKNLFKNDKNGLGRLSFALMFAIDERNLEYQCPDESLEVVSEILFDDPKKLGRLYRSYRTNYMKIQKPFPDELESAIGVGTGIGGALALSVMPLFVTGTVAVLGHLLNRKAALDSFASMSTTETHAMLAFRLTLIEYAGELGEGKRKEMTDAMLEEVGNIRSDAEYKWYVEGVNIPECREKIEVCNLTLARLAKILGV